MRALLLSALMLVGGTAAQAETLQDLCGRIVGAEVEITGHIGTGLDMTDDEALTFRDPEGTVYPVVFDAGRTARKSLEGCKFEMFSGGTPCAMSGKAEVELDGSRLRLIVYEVADIAAPAPLN